MHCYRFLEDVRAKRIANAYSLMTDILASQKIPVPNSYSPSPRGRAKKKTRDISDCRSGSIPTTGHVSRRDCHVSRRDCHVSRKDGQRMSKSGHVTNRLGYRMTDTVQRSSGSTIGVNCHCQQSNLEDCGVRGRVVHESGKSNKHSPADFDLYEKNVKFSHSKSKSLIAFLLLLCTNVHIMPS